MRKNKRIFLCCIMSLMMALVMAVPMSVSAADMIVKSSEGLTTAINSVDDGAVIKLGANIDGVISVPEGKNITIDLNGFNIDAAGQSNHTITNRGILTIIGSGKVINNINSRAAVYTAPNAETTLNGGSFEGTSWYVIKNLGMMTIDGATVNQKDAGSSAIDNGYYGSPGNDCGENEPASAEVTLVIESGTFNGGMNIVKNDDLGVLDIKGGTFMNTDGPAVLNWNEANISGGTFTINDVAAAVIANGYLSDTADKGKLTISGGNFKGANNGNDAIFGYAVGGTKGGNVIVEGGVFEGYVGKDSEFPYTPEIKGGTFTSLDHDNVKINSDAVAQITENGETKTVVGLGNINDTLKDLEAGASVVITKAAEGAEFDVPVGVTVKNDTTENIVVNDQALAAGDEEVIEENSNPTDPTDPTDPTNPTDPGTTDPTNPTDPADTNEDAVQTGDDTNLALPMGLALVALLGIGGALAARRRHN